MKQTNTHGFWSSRDEDQDEYDNEHRRPVGDSLFSTNRHFASDYANYDTQHAADYQRHGDFADEYNNIRQGYYADRGMRGGNSLDTEPGSYGWYSSSSDLAGYGGGGVYRQDSICGHRGKGPKSYVRSDERIREDVSDRLRDDDHIDASDIEVTVSQSEVVLSGTVDSRFAKRHAEDLAESVAGVRNVENRIRVKV